MGGVKYALHLEGTVQCQMTPEGDCMNHPVPLPAAAWLLGSGLLGLIGVARCRKQQAGRRAGDKGEHFYP